MQVRYQIHAPAALPRGGREALSHTEWDDEWAPNRAGILGEKLLSLPGIA